jgi:hypothetical protein
MKSMNRFVWVLACLAAGCGDDAVATDGGTAGMDARPSLFDAGDRPDAPSIGCTAASQCPEASTEPARCAEASCEAGRCVYRALDRDGDGFGTAVCTSSEVAVEAGSDCDDDDPMIAPGLPERCNALDDDCDTGIDDDIPADTSRPCEVGTGVCRASGSATCVMGEWSGCDAIALPPEGADSPRCDGIDHDCDGVVNTGCDCTSGTDLGECVHRCGRSRVVCTGGRNPGCDPYAGEVPHTRCWDGDSDGHFAPGAMCQEFCSPGTTGSVTAWSGDTRWLEPAGRPSDDCHDGRADVHPGLADSSCDGVDQDCSGSEPAVGCGRCGAVGCGAACPSCPAGWYDSGSGCRTDGTYEEGFGMGDALRGDYGGGASGGWYSIPGTPGVDEGHFEFRIWHRRVDPGGCCWEGDSPVAWMHCDNAAGVRVRSRLLVERDFWRSDWDLAGSQYVHEAGTDLAGGACWFNLIDNRRYCCCGCVRRFNQISAYATSPRCI